MLNKREIILKAVIKIIEKEGLHGNIVVSKIAESAGIGKGTIYEYFNTKEEVIGEAIRYFIKDKIQTVIDTNNYDNLNFKDSFKRYIDDVITFLTRDEFLYQIYNFDDLNYRFTKKMKTNLLKDLEAVREKYQTVINYFIDKGIKEKVISNKVSDFTRNSIRNIILPNIIDFIHNNSLDKKEDFIDNLYDLIYKILK